MLTKLVLLGAFVGIAFGGLLPKPQMMKMGQGVDPSVHQQFSQFKQIYSWFYYYVSIYLIFIEIL